MPLDSEILLQAQGICKSFPGVQALSDVQLTVRRGRLTALVGENGAGKSTLMNILAGVFPPDQGHILLHGKPVSFPHPRAAQQAGISIIFQELNLVPQLSVAENIFLGREPLNRFGLIDYRKMNSHARELLSKLDLDIDPRTTISRLRVGTQQIVEIAKALSLEASVIIMDEPTSAISDQEIEALFRLIQQLKERGVGIIYITHKLYELPHIADALTVLRDGRLIDERPFSDVTHDEIVRLMVGRELTEATSTRAAPGANVLEVRGLSLCHPNRPGDYAIRDISFAVCRGEVLGIFGLMGAGRTELLHSIFGLHPDTSSGQVLVEGRPVNIGSPQDAIRVGIALVPEDRKAEGLVLTMSVAENASLSCLERAIRFGLLQPALERKLVAGFSDRLGIKSVSSNQRVRYLSGGNQQKIVLAKWLAVRPKILLLDEPTRGIDVNAKREIYGVIEELAREGLGIVLVSSELPEILALTDRILVLSDGRITNELLRSEATEEKLLKAALPKGTARKAKSA